MDANQSHVYDMGYTPHEFSKTLLGGFSDERSPYRVSAVGQFEWRISDEEGLLVGLSIAPKPARKLGLLELPVLSVNFQIIEDKNQVKSKFFDKFFKYFHKGGG